MYFAKLSMLSKISEHFEEKLLLQRKIRPSTALLDAQKRVSGVRVGLSKAAASVRQMKLLLNMLVLLQLLVFKVDSSNASRFGGIPALRL